MQSFWVLQQNSKNIQNKKTIKKKSWGVKKKSLAWDFFGFYLLVYTYLSYVLYVGIPVLMVAAAWLLLYHIYNCAAALLLCFLGLDEYRTELLNQSSYPVIQLSSSTSYWFSYRTTKATTNNYLVTCITFAQNLLIFYNS